MNEQQLKTLDESIAALADGDYESPCSGYRQVLYLDPEEHALDLFATVGPGMPEAAWHNRYAYICDIPTGAIPSSVHSAIAAVRDRIVSVCDAYLGSECDDRCNYIGRWREDPDEDTTAVFEGCEPEILTYWDPDEWFSGDGTDDNIRQLLGAGETPESILADLWLGDESTGEVREADALEWIRGLAS